MKKPNRIGLSLFDEELLSLINASAKIFPITQDMINNNLNPDNYEYGRIERSIYRWHDNTWDYIVADDIDIEWLDIKNKPTTYPPSTHNHEELHTHVNKLILDLITEELINTWNTVVEKADESNVNVALNSKSDINHDHNLDYAVKEVEGTVSDHESRLFNIENGYTEGHSHPNVSMLNSITQAMVDAWNTINDKSDKSYVDTELSKKAPLSTLSGHIDNSTVHVTSIDKANWNSKAEGIHTHDMEDIEGLSLDWSAIDNKPSTFAPSTHSHSLNSLSEKSYTSLTDKPTIPTKLSELEADVELGGNFATIGTVKPADGSMWYEVI